MSHWQQFHIYQAKIEALYTPKIQKIFKAQAKAFNNFAKVNGYDRAVNKIHDYFNAEELLPVINQLHTQCAGQWGGKTYKEILKGAKSYAPAFITKRLGDNRQPVKLPFSANAEISRRVVAELRMNLLVNVHGITDTVRKQIGDIIAKGNIEGWGYDKTATQIETTVGSKYRALRIVRTESVKSSNAGAYEGAKLTGLKMNKIWRSAQDNRVRGNPNGKYPLSQFDHWDMNGQKVTLEGKFFLGSRSGASDELRYPGDANGQAGDIINCRCVASYEPVRDANGRVVRISTPAQPARPAMMAIV